MTYLEYAAEAASHAKVLAEKVEDTARRTGDIDRMAEASALWASVARAYAAVAGALPAPTEQSAAQPECVMCGVTEVNLVRAAAAGWRRVLGHTTCASCVRPLPAWASRQF